MLIRFLSQAAEVSKLIAHCPKSAAPSKVDDNLQKMSY